MHNFIFGLVLGWVIFTDAGRESAMIAYYYLDKAGDRIATRVAEDLPEPRHPDKIRIPRITPSE